MNGNRFSNFSDYLLSRGKPPVASGGGLKDFFIPHAGNNYHPHALHPWRLFFYALSAVIVKLIIVGFILSLPLDAWLAPDAARAQVEKIIALTNELRQSLGVNLVRENTLLAQAAYEKVSDMLVRQYFAHMSPEKKGLAYWLKLAKYDFETAGENLALGFDDAASVVEAWRKSPTHYSNLIDRDFTEIGVAISTGNFQKVDTTLMAQYFGRRRTETARAAAASRNVRPPAAPRPAVEKEEDKKVLAKNIKPVRPAPTLEIIYPDDDLVTNRTPIDFKLVQRDADAVSVYDNDTLVWRKETSKENELPFDLELKEGTHNLKFEAAGGGNGPVSKTLSLTVDLQAPTVDLQKSSLMLVGRNDKAVEANVFLTPDTAAARLEFFGNRIDLKRGDEANQWYGRKILYGDGGEIPAKPLVPAVLVASDQAGNVSQADLDWQNVTPATPGALNQYLFVKNERPGYARLLFDATSAYYKILLVAAVVILLLNILIEIRIQHHHVIASTLGLVALLILLIIV